MIKKLTQIVYRNYQHPHYQNPNIQVTNYQYPYQYIQEATYYDGTVPEIRFYDEVFIPLAISPLFLIGNHGTIYDIQAQKLVKPNLDNSGYPIVYLRYNSGRNKIHRLVMMSFQPVPNMNELHVNHKDGNHLNNYWSPIYNLSNLEWCTPSYNSYHAHQTGLWRTFINQIEQYCTKNDIEKICEYISKGFDYKEIMKNLDIKISEQDFKSLVYKIRNRTLYKKISQKYIFEPKIIKHTEEEIKICCELIQNGMPYETIVEYMRDQYGYQLTYDFVRTLKTNKNWKYITKDYNFPSHLKRPISEETIHQICYLLQSGITDYKKIAKELEMELDQRLRLIIYSLYTKSHYKEICDQYNYKFESKNDILTENEVKLICHGLVKKMNSREIVEQLLHKEYTMSLKSKINQIKHRKNWTEISKHYDFNI